MVLVSYILNGYISFLQTKFSDREGHEARRVRLVVYLPPADKYHGLTHRLSQEQKDIDERALLASQRPSQLDFIQLRRIAKRFSEALQQ
jgi:hypothetical protein